MATFVPPRTPEATNLPAPTRRRTTTSSGYQTTNKTAGLPSGIADIYANPGYDQDYEWGSATRDRVPYVSPTATDQPLNWPTTYGGGGGGYSAPKIDYSNWAAWAAAAQPEAYKYRPLNLPTYKPVPFYEFDETPYMTARSGVQSGIADARAQGDTAFNLAAQRYLDYEDPYAGGPQTYNPGVDPRLLDSIAAWGGAGSGAAAETFNEGVQADAAMGSVYDLLSKVGRQFNEGQLAGIEGDRMQLNQRLGNEERMLNLGVDMALARAKSDYKKERWLYGKEAADRNFEMKVQQALARNAGFNQQMQFNVNNRNQFNTDILNQILQMIASGGTGVPTTPERVMV